MQFIDQISDAIKGDKSRAFLSDGTDDVIFDVVLNNVEGDTLQVTRHAVEYGADITDHVVSMPKSFMIEAVLSDDTQDLLNPSSFANKKIDERLGILQRWIDDKTVLTYYGHEQDFASVVIQDLSRKKTTEVGEGLGISLSIAQITIARSQVTDVNVTSSTVKGKTAKQSDSKSGDESKSKNKSWLKSLMS